MEQSQKKTAIKQLAAFLKQFNYLKAKPVLDINSYYKTIWFYNIPNEKECCIVTKNLESANLMDGQWIKIKKPIRAPCPKPPPAIKPWIKKSETEVKPPALMSAIFKPGPALEESSLENQKIYLENYPEITKSFEDYINQKWRPWFKEEQRLQPVSKIYNTFYSIYEKYQNAAEEYEIKLGLGFLSAKNKKNKNIKRHIVTAPAAVHFDAAEGSITVGPAEEDVMLSLEMDMLADSEKPKNCDNLNAQLSNLNNDFWKAEEFYTCLKSWMNSYSSQGQFFKNFNEPGSYSFAAVTVSPAVIFRKRNEKTFIKFYDSVMKGIDNHTEEYYLNNYPCLEALVSERPARLLGEAADREKKPVLAGKYYFPLPANKEQKNIIEKTHSHNQVVVQGPPGTGKTHSIANLISHFLSEGKKILITSQTDRALKVLRNKLPEKIKPLCIEILGQDQKAFEDLKKSFSEVRSQSQKWRDNLPQLTRIIEQLEKKDTQLQAKLVQLKSKLLNLRQFETKTHQQLFGFYTGTPAVISRRLKKETPKYSWIKQFFCSQSTLECPVLNTECQTFLKLLKSLQGTNDILLQEPINFLDQILTPQKMEQLIKQEQTAALHIKDSKADPDLKPPPRYEKLSPTSLNQLSRLTTGLEVQVKSLLNQKTPWVTKALNNCLMDQDREWSFLYHSTKRLLDQSDSLFSAADEIQSITGPKSLQNEAHILSLLNILFKSSPGRSHLKWGFFNSIFSKPIRQLKQIKLNGKYISSYKEALTLDHYMKAKKAIEQVSLLWKNHNITLPIKRGQFTQRRHLFKDLCEPLKECLNAHKTMQQGKHILSQNNIPLQPWDAPFIKQLNKIIKWLQAKQTVSQIQKEFKTAAEKLEPYACLKTSFIKQIIASYKERNIKDYKNIIEQIQNFKDKQAFFVKMQKIKQKFNNNPFYKTLRKTPARPLWEERLLFFEQAWAWQKADQWLARHTNEDYAQQINLEKEDLLKQQQNNMEQLTAQKAWHACLRGLTPSELSSLSGWVQSIKKIGKGTGKTAAKHRKTAKKRMEECKTAIPAWIMPLYRVVENINPSNPLFDIAIIDEASQTGPDGFLLNYLAKKIIIVGDQEQISPENPGLSDSAVESLKHKYLSQNIKLSDYIGREFSYYDYYETVFTSSHIQLREHFRCMPEIIQFSNSICYSGIPLIPMRQYGSDRLKPLKATYVEQAVSRVGSGKEPQNEQEANTIAAEIQNCIRQKDYNSKTFGIIVLQGQAQIRCIENAISSIDKTEIEKRKIHIGSPYNFQGDERDVIFLSMAIADDWPKTTLTKETYKKMYNVAASRAKDQMWLFYSVQLNHLSSNDFRRKLLQHCIHKPKPIAGWPHKELTKLHQKIKETPNKSPENAPQLFHKPDSSFGSWFEARVFLMIALKGYNVIPQWAVSYYRIDMVIIGSQNRLAVECDGEYWHTSEEQQTADIDRQAQLERCGWTFWRLRESAFNKDEQTALKPLWEQLDKMKIYPL